MKKLFSALLFTLLVGSTIITLKSSALAFNADNLMDDGVFNRYTSMSAAAIDTWINQFPNSCISSNSGFRTADPQGWSTAQGKYLFGGNVTAGQAIYDTAQLYHVNPQVILATLQKEQSVVTGASGCHYDRPNPADSSQLYTCTIGGVSTTCTDACPFSYGGGCMNIAMSYNCPGSCKASSEGFSLQLTLGTWILRFSQERAYGILTGYPGYEQGDENFFYSGPMTAGWRQRISGGTLDHYDGTYTTADNVGVTIANGATASLYTYTPFTNGNNSFDTLFQNWFGSIYDVYSWSIVSQYAFTDSSKTTAVDLTDLYPGQKVFVGFTAKNTGDTTWTNTGYSVRVGTTSPQDRSSPFCDTASWLGCNRPTAMKEASVDPGQTGTFEFWYVAPQQTGTYREHFSLLAEGLKWFNDPGLSIYSVVSRNYSWSLVDHYAYTDSSKTTPVSMSNMVAGQKIFVGFHAKNTGNMTWTNNGANPVRVGTSNPQDRSSAFCDPSWLGCNRPAALKEASVAPGQTGTFEFWFTANRTGTFEEHFTPLVEGYAWMSNLGLNFNGTVRFDTSGSASQLSVNSALNSGQTLTSSDGRYRLAMQGDGNFVLYSINRALWASSTNGKPISKAVMQGDGNLVLYDAQSKPYWASNTPGRGSSRLVLQDDGNLVIYNSSNHATWASNTNGQL
jgi:hypothetical protein